MEIILLSKPNPLVEFMCLCSEPFRNDSMQKMAILLGFLKKDVCFHCVKLAKAGKLEKPGIGRYKSLLIVTNPSFLS